MRNCLHGCMRMRMQVCMCMCMCMHVHVCFSGQERISCTKARDVPATAAPLGPSLNVYTFAHTRACTRTHARTHAPMHPPMHPPRTRARVRTDALMPAPVHPCAPRAHPRTHAHTHTRTHACVHIPTPAPTHQCTDAHTCAQPIVSCTWVYVQGAARSSSPCGRKRPRMDVPGQVPRNLLAAFKVYCRR